MGFIGKMNYTFTPADKLMIEICDDETLIHEVDLSIFEGYHWTVILRDYPHLSSYCKWETLQEDDWGHLLRFQPKFEVYYKGWKLKNR